MHARDVPLHGSRGMGGMRSVERRKVNILEKFGWSATNG